MTNTGIKSAYQINGIEYDILTEFAATYDEVDEEAYTLNMQNFINNHCIEEINNEYALDLLEETYVNYGAYFQKHIGPNWNTFTPHQLLKFTLMKKLLIELPEGMIKSAYQLNSVEYDILTEFAATYDEVDEEAYTLNMQNFINNYCIEQINNEYALDLLEETYVNYGAYFQKHIGASWNTFTPHQLLRFTLMKKLLIELSEGMIKLVKNTEPDPTDDEL